ncbi:hypothetical protein DY000_02037239 [Brassica cretica]|uniref:Secreted protein n=1 Tax=Brassica cretica TaxID=69181 RepID=A0ABQ7BN12_BRACR|nr:hypothetical protein DY000_02037239 [Brassica cretica]
MSAFSCVWRPRLLSLLCFAGSVSGRKRLLWLRSSPAYESEVWRLCVLHRRFLIVTPFLKAAWRLRKRSRHGSTEAFRQRSSAVGGGGEIGYGFRCWVACFLRQWRLEKGSGDTCASQLRSQHVRRALAFGAVASCVFLGLLLGRF